MLRRFLLAAILAVLAAAPALAQQNPSFNVLNQSNRTINEVYASPAGVTNWGRDRLGDNTIPPGQSFAIRLPADGNCVYDIRVVYDNGQAEERRGLNTCNLDNVAFSGRGTGRDRGDNQQSSNDPSFRVVNRGRVDINEVYATPTGVDSWGRDLLGRNTVPPGDTYVIRLPRGQCMYDVRVVFANGQPNERRNINLCNVTDLPFP